MSLLSTKTFKNACMTNDNTVQQIWTNLSFFGWHRLILTKVHSLNPNLVSVFLQHPHFLVTHFLLYRSTLKFGPLEYQNWWVIGKF